MRRQPRLSTSQMLRCAAVSALVLAGCWATTLLPWPGGVQAPAVVQYAPLHVVRVATAGFVEEVCVAEGQLVAPGDKLVQLSNPHLVQRRDDVQLEIEQSGIRSRVLLQQEGRTAEYLVENRNRQALLERLEQLQRDVDSLTVLATCHGRVLGRNLDALIGQYAEMGRELMAVGSEQQKQLEASVAEEDVEYFRASIGKPARVYVRGVGQIGADSRLLRLNPRATTDVQHPALLASYGGPLAVSILTSRSEATSGEPQVSLPKPRFTVIFQLPEEVADGLRAGQVALVKLGAHRRTVGSVLRSAWKGWTRWKVARFGDV